MKNLATIILTIVSICSKSFIQDAEAQQIQDFEFVLGTWKNSKDGSFEAWQWSSDFTQLTGKSFKVNNNDTTVMELMSIACESNACYFIADVPQNSAPVKFKIAKYTKSNFVADNPSHDFPKFIQYDLLDKNHLNALIGGGSKLITFKFERAK